MKTAFVSTQRQTRSSVTLQHYESMRTASSRKCWWHLMTLCDLLRQESNSLRVECYHCRQQHLSRGVDSSVVLQENFERISDDRCGDRWGWEQIHMGSVGDGCEFCVDGWGWRQMFVLVQPSSPVLLQRIPEVHFYRAMHVVQSAVLLS